MKTIDRSTLRPRAHPWGRDFSLRQERRWKTALTLMLLILGGWAGGASAAGLRVSRIEAQGAAGTPFNVLEVQFNQDIQDGTFTLADIASFTGPGGAVTVSSVNKVTNQRYVINATGTVLNSYSLEINIGIQDMAGDTLDQDGDGNPGEAVEDAYRVRMMAGNDNSITAGNMAFDGQALLFALGSATVDGSHSFAHVESQRSATPVFTNAATLTFRSLRADTLSSLRIGGGATLNVTEGITVTGTSELRLKAKDNTGVQYIGTGVTINTPTASVAAGSAVTAKAEGYFNGNGPGYNGSGAAHGGRGSSSQGQSQQPTYGSALQPVALGSGGAVFNAGSAGGGAIRLNVTGTLTLEGEVNADGDAGGQIYNGASGGSIWATAGTLTGAGAFTARGTIASGGVQEAGGGGRIAVYYGNGAAYTGFAASSVASGGGTSAEKGTLLFMDTNGGGSVARVTQRFVLEPDQTVAWDSLTLDPGALFILEGGATLGASGAVTIPATATVQMRGKNRSGQVLGQWAGRGGIIQAGSLTLAAGALITADAEGYINSSGPGYQSNSGGTHGGLGSGANASLLNGVALAPIELGSGANAFNNTFVTGGGAIRLIVTGTLTVDGEVTADAFGNGGAQEGAAGGSIWVTAGTLAGSGLFTANGVKGGDPGRRSGSGGRIAVHYTTDGGFTGFLPSKVDAGLPNGTDPAEPGTLIFVHNTPQGQNLRISQRYQIAANTNFTANHLTIDDGALFDMGGGATLDVAETLTLTGNSTLRVRSKNNDAQVAGQWVGRGGVIEAKSLVIDAGSVITADAEGYFNSRGPGYNGNNGGSHGGMGGNSNTNLTYGDPLAPVELGSGANAFNNTFTVGGGAIRLIVEDTLTNHGEVTADAFGTGGAQEGSAGGSIWVTTGTLAGTGIFTANGFQGGDNNRSNGAGGRIAVYYSSIGNEFVHASSTVNRGTNPSGAVAEDGTMIFVKTYPQGPPDVRLTQRFRVEPNAIFAAKNLVVDDAALLEIGGNATVNVSGAMSVTQGSEVRFESIDRGSAIGGEHTGRGSRLHASSLTVDATSKFNADSWGYVANVGPGYHGSFGSSHGGSGHVPNPPEAGPLYGDARAPVELGSGAAGNGFSPPGGGAIEVVVGGTFTLNGAISASAQNGGGFFNGASGGSVYVRAGTMTGSGIIHADGGPAWTGGAREGAGGRVAVLGVTAPAWTAAQITVDRGTIGQMNAGPGTEVIDTTTQRFLMFSPNNGYAHGQVPFEYAGLGYDAATTTATVQVRRGGATFPVATGRGVVDRLTWDSSAISNGPAELHVVFRNASQQIIGEGSAPILINNTVQWHGGTLASSQAWAAGVVHVVEQDVIVPAGVTLTIDAGAVVKFLPGRRLIAINGGIVDADAATPLLPVLMTSIADDSSGGDTNLDGDLTRGQPGDWLGVAVQGGGQFLTSVNVETRFAQFRRSGNIQTQTWPSRSLNIVRDDVTVDGGHTLTIGAGAVVKFVPGRRLIVNGDLQAPGTFAQPIAFTSMIDDSRGGDTNKDGNTTTPFAGDWRQIRINGSATLDHCHIGFGVGENATDGMIRVAGTAVLRSCTVAETLFSGIFVTGNATVENCLILRTDRGLDAQGGTLVARNCTLHDNRIGLFAHGGAFTVHNSIVTGGAEGATETTGPVTVRHCNIFGNTANYVGMPPQTGSNGNISADPQYRNEEQDDFHLTFGSAGIDAADGTQAPLTDRSGAPRYDDPRTANTGAGSPAFADIGAFELVEAANVASNLDLGVSNVAGPGSALAGDTVTVTWTIRNAGTETIVGPWFDAVAMREAGGAAAPQFAAEFETGIGVVLGPGQTFAASGQVRVPGGAPGRYEWQVLTNSHGTVFEGQNSGNNLAVAAVAFDLDLKELVVGDPATMGAFAAVDQPQWFKVRRNAGQQARVSLDLTGTGVTELLVARGRIPTRQIFEAKQSQFAAADTSVVLPGNLAQTYFVLAYPAALSAPPQAFSIIAESQSAGLSSLTHTQIGGDGRVTIGFNGALLSTEATYELIGPGGTIAATELSGDSSRVFATFDLVNLAPGAYSARVTIGAQVFTLNNAVTVLPPGGATNGQVEVRVVGPPAVREARTASVTVEVKNTNNVDVYAPVLRLTVDGWAPAPRPQTQGVAFFAAAGGATGSGGGGGGRTVIEIVEIHYLPPPVPEKVRKQFIVMPLNPQNPAGILPPGFTAQIVLDGIPELGSEEIELFVEDLDPAALLDHASAKASYKPADVPDAAWDVIYANFIAGLGAGTSSANATLAKSANYLSAIGQRPTEMSDILRWELCKASDFGTIASRHRLGPFGYGSDPMEVRLKHVDDPREGVAEEVHVIRAGSTTGRAFTRKTGATAYVAVSPGDTGTLVKLGPASYEVRQPGGAVMRFDTPGLTAGDLLLTHVDDARQRRIVYNYVAGRLAAIANDLGQQRTFGYNGAGRVTTATNEYGVTTTYGYDPSNEHLTSITEIHAGMTLIEHYQGEGAAKEHAVKKVTGPDGRITNYEFDSRGRPSKVSRGVAKTEPLTFTYDADGGTITTDAAGGVSRFSRDSLGRVVRTKNHGQNMLEMLYDPFGNQVVTNIPASGLSLRTEHDQNHNLTALYDLAGGAARMTYHPVFQVPASYTDRRSQTTRYTYDDAAGKPNLRRIDYPGGSHEELTYDSRSRVHTHTNARGQTVTWDYDAQDMLTRKTYPNGDYDDFFYNGNRQNTSIVRHIGVTTETTTLEYDAVSRLLTKVTYPNGRFISYTHDSAGRRASTTTQDGFTTRWDYDSNGRLFHVRNGASEILVTLTYDVAGRLAARTLANGAATTYTYNPAGRIQQVTHKDPAEAVIATYTYAYDALGNCISMNGPGGLTEYEYDVHGQLVQVDLPGGRSIRYAYDAEGNRTEVNDGGVITPYEPDHLNQYRRIGNTSLMMHDEDGNVGVGVVNGQSSAYTYDPLNHLVSSSSPGENINFEYDALGNLSASTRNGVRTEFLTDPLVGGDVVGEYGTGGLVAHYVHGEGLGARVDAGGDAAWYLFDGSGHTSHLINDDGNVVNSYRYLPFGEPLGAQVEGVPNRFRYGGARGLMDEGGGLLHVRARFYSPEMGRFLQRDPGFVYASNPYLYCENHPVGRMDVDGADTSPADQNAQDVQNSADAGTLGGLLLDATTAAAQKNVDNLITAGSESLQAANANKSVAGALQLQKQGEGLLKQAANGPAAKSLNLAKGAGNLMNGLGVAAEAGNLLLGDGTKPGLVDRLNSNDPNERMSANADGVLFVAKNTLKLLTSEIPFSGEIIDGGIIIVDKGSQAAFEWWFTPDEEDPEEVFNHEAYWRFRKGQKTKVIRSFDPNDITGPAGFGPDMWVDDGGTMHYTIRFENKSDAEAAAYRVLVTQPLDADLDWSTFEFEEFGFAGTRLTSPPGLQNYLNRATVATDPNPVKIIAGLDAQTGVVTWLMESFDAVTGELPEDPFAGFLPPNNANGDGEGFLTYSIKPKAGLTGTVAINAQAGIIFDTNPTLDTNIFINRVETGTPVGTVVALPPVIPFGRGGFLVRWGGAGSLSGIASYDVYVSDNGSPLTLWIDDTTLTSAVYPGVAGHTYAFVVTATDNVGQTSLLTSGAQVQTQMGVTPLFVSATYLSGISHADATRQIEGLLRSTVTRGGSVTGSLRFNGKLWSFAGKLDAMNRITVPLSRSVPAMELRFEHYYGATSAELRGVLASSAFEAPFQAAMNPYTRLAPCPAAGLYTALLDPASGQTSPAVTLTDGGHATMSISNLGTVLMNGRLPNNMTFSASSTLRTDGHAPFYVQLPGGKGIITGGPQFQSPAVNATFAGGLRWNKPLTLTTLQTQNLLDITGSRYVKTIPAIPLATDADVLLDGGALAAPLNASFTFAANGTITMAAAGGPQKIRLVLHQATGLLTGSFLSPGTTKTFVPLRGVLLQSQQLGGGCFFRSGQQGVFTVQP